MSPQTFYLLFLSFFLISAQDGFQTRSFKELMSETDDLSQVFLNKTCLSTMSWPDTKSTSNISNITISNIEMTPKSIDLSKQTVTLVVLETSIVFSDANAEIALSFEYLMEVGNETKEGKIHGKLALYNISNHKQITLTNGKPHFFTTSISIMALDLIWNNGQDKSVTDAFYKYYEKNVDELLLLIRTNMTDCLNDWVYPQEELNFLAPYGYQYKNRIVKYTYQVTNLLFGKNFMGFWFKSNIYNFTKEKWISLNPNTILKQLANDSQTFYSKSIFINTIAYALELNAFDVNLDDFEYPSEHFDYFIGEVALFSPEIRKVFYADEKISGFCKVSAPENVTYDLIENEGFYVMLPYVCNIHERNTKTPLFNFSVSLNFSLVPTITKRIMDLTIKSVTAVENSFKMYEKEEFPLIKPQLIDYHLQKFLEEMLDGKTFGSHYSLRGDKMTITADGIILTAS